MPQRERFPVLIVDENPMMGFAMFSVANLHPLLRVSDVATDFHSAREFYAKTPPRFVILDIDLGRGDGLELVREFSRNQPKSSCLVMSEVCDATIVQRTFDAGARAYLSKGDEAGHLFCALEAVIAGETYLGERVKKSLSAQASRKLPHKALKFLGSLSDRELHVFQKLADGQGVTAIAQKLGVSVKTVETHLAHIKTKLHLVGSADLHRVAASWAAVSRD